MKKVLTLVSIVLVLSLAVVLNACGTNTSSNKSNPVVPTYQGMTISKETTVNTMHYTSSPYTAYPIRLKNSLLNSDEIPVTDEHSEHNETLENDIEDIVTIKVDIDDEVKYYVQPNETFIIQVHISNPYDYEIQSFTLNGKKYANYMFKDGSTMELLLLEVTAPSTSGYIEYSIDAIKYIDGTEIKDVDMSTGNKSIKAGIAYTEAPTAQIVSQNITTTSFTVEINIFDNNSLIGSNELSIYLSDGQKILAKKDLKIGENSITFDNLTMSTTYEYGVITAYDLIDGRDVHSEWLLKNRFTTLGAFSFNNVKTDKTSISFEINRTGEVGTIKSISLYDANTRELINSGDSSIRLFENLLSNHTYNLYADFVYMINGEEISDYTCIKGIMTKAKVKPTLSFDNVSITDSTISEVFVKNDPDNIGTIDNVKLYKGGALQQTNSSKLINFTELEYYTDYKVVIEFSYDLNDGNGLKNETCERTYKTSPYLDFNTCKIINTSAVSEGETIYMQATIDNPLGALPSSAVVNGQVYNCTGSTTANKIYIEIVNNGQFEGGNTTLVIEKINVTLDNTTYTINANSNNSGTVFINGVLSVESLQFVNANNEIVDYCMPGDKMYLLLTLRNKTGYTIDNVTINRSTITTLTKIDDEHYKIYRTPNNGWNSFSITSITYHNAYINKTLSIGNCSSNRVYKTNTSTVTEISTVEQLMSTNYNGGYYKLTADIDLSGIEWTNLGHFSGVFDGNNHYISNMSNVSTISDTDISIGLFKSASGVFINTDLTDVTLMITLTSSSNDSYNAYIGGFVAGNRFDDDLYALFRNCNVVGDISVNNTTGGTAYAGGIIGYEFPYPPYLYIEDCSVEIDISLKNGNQKIGVAAGIVGYYSWGNLEIYVYNCNIKGSINAQSASVINGDTPYGPCTVDYKNNSCDISLNGEKETAIDDYYLYIE